MPGLGTVEALVAKWRTIMDLDRGLIITAQVGMNVEAIARAAGMAEALALGFTIGNDDNTEFSICIDTKAVDDPRLEHIIVHELVHVWSFSQVGSDLRDNMEALTDELARMILDKHGALSPRTGT